MNKFAKQICKHKNIILIITAVLFVLSFVGMKLTKINYDILVYLPEDIETVQGQNILTNDFGMGSYSVVITENMNSKELLKLEEEFKKIDGVNQVISAYDVIGTTIPIEMLPNEITEKFHQENTDIMFVTFSESTSSEKTINAISDMKDVANDKAKISGMSAMVLDTMELSDKEIAIYVVIAVTLCLIVLELSLDSYLVPVLLLGNIGIAIIFNLGSNIIFGEISYITKALVAVLQLGVTTDFSIFLYHAYENKKSSGMAKEKAMTEAIVETFTSVTGSSLTTIAGFLVLCTMNLTLGKDLGLVMAKGVLLGVITVLTVFPSLLLVFDNQIDKTKHKPITVHFEKLNKFVIRHYKPIFITFLLLLVPAYLANSKVDVYYKIDESLPDTLDSIVANTDLKNKFNIVSPEVILIDKNMKTDKQQEMISRIEQVDGIDFVLSFSKLKELGLTENMLPSDLVKVFESENYQMLFLNSTYDIATTELNNQVTEVNKIIKEYDEKSILAGEGPLMKDLVLTSDEDFNNVNYSSIICILLIMVVVLKSVSLPILLILAIEFAIFMNMSVSYFSGVVLPFVAPIVLGTIQLGATIDYAILMTTNYLRLRKDGLEKKEAMLQTTNYCSNSIFVSGMCFFAATFGVGVYSDLEMVGSLCTLISRGAIISMIVVITVLPSILLIFDSIILKTTLNMQDKTNMKGKKNMKNNKKNMKKVVATGLVLTLALTPISTLALSREETVYAKLNTDGSIKNIIVNEHLINSDKLDTIEDYTELENILNINSDHTYTRQDNLLTWDSKGSDIFYQGTTNQQAPVSEEITYKLNGEKVELKDLIGKSGKVEITLKYKNLDKHVVNNQTLYTPFVVTTATMIDAKNNSNITVTNGKVVNSGNNFIVVGLSTPGLYESMNLDELKGLDTVTISYDTTKFELASIYSVITSKLIDNSDLDIFTKLNNVYGNVNQLQESINKIESGSKTILDNLTLIDDGTTELATKVNLLLTKIEAIKNGSANLDSNLDAIISTLDGVINTFNSDENKAKINDIKTLMDSNNSTIILLTNANTTSKKACEDYHLTNMTYAQVEALNNSDLINAKYICENSLDSNNQLIYLLTKDNEALTASLQNLSDIQTQINTLSNYLKQLKDGTNELATGTSALYDGVNVLNTKVGTLSTGATALKDGMTNLNNGIVEFNNQGIKKLSGMASQISAISNRANTLMKLGEDYQTIQSKNGKVESSTKFILVVDGVKAPKETKQTAKETKKVSFIDRIKNLFK